MSSNSSANRNTNNAAANEPDPETLKAKYGYAVLGGVNPENTDPTIKDTPRLNPKRLFQPGQTYSPHDLNPFAPKQHAPRLQTRITTRIASNEDAIQYGDFKNIDFLARFVTDAGRLKSRRLTKLKPTVHSRLMKSIKLARIMALMPHEARYEDQQRARLRSFNDATLMQRMMAGSSGGSGGSSGGGSTGGDVTV